MGTLSLVSTPIGNLEDITIRAIKTLFTSDVILCEDTRRTGILLSEISKRYGEMFDVTLQWQPPLMAYYEEVELRKIPEIMNLLAHGKQVALVTDSGTPLISDPGYKLVTSALKRGFRIESIPGPAAFVAALVSSGLPPSKSLFLGYPPEKKSHRRKLIQNLMKISQILTATYIFYVAPHKLVQFLTDIQEVLGDQEIVLARELTKVHEEIWRGKITAALRYFSSPKGELVLLFQLT